MTAAGDRRPLPVGRAHIAALQRALAGLDGEVERIESYGRRIAGILLAGGRLLAVGNGGSAAEAQHLTSELVGRYRDDRPAFSAISLHAEPSALTAITNDYGPAEAFARQVRAHGRPGDVLVALSTSGRSANVVAAARTAQQCRLWTLALTGALPNPLAGVCADAVAVDSTETATVQEVHQVVVHLLCATIDVTVGAAVPATEEWAGR